MKPDFKPMPGLTTRQANIFQHHKFIKELIEKIKHPETMTAEDLLDVLQYADEIKDQQLQEAKTREYWAERQAQQDRSRARLADPNWDRQKGYINKEKGNE